MASMLYAGATIFRFRWLLYELVLRDLKLRYRNSLLGFAWTILNPVLFMLIYVLVFGVYLRLHIPNYPLYLLAGIVPWNWVVGAIPAATTAIPDGRMYVGKAIFPIEFLVLVPVLSNAVNFLLSLALLIALIPALGGHVGLAIAFLPLVILGQLLIVTGSGFFVATFNTFYRDLQQLVGYLLTATLFMTPIFYTRATIPEHLVFLVQWSPIAAMIAAYQSILYSASAPSSADLAFMYLFGLLLFAFGLERFQRFRDHFGDYV